MTPKYIHLYPEGVPFPYNLVWARHVGFTLGLGWTPDGEPIYEWSHPGYPSVRGLPRREGGLIRTDGPQAGMPWILPSPRIVMTPPSDWDADSPFAPEPADWEWSEAKYHQFLGFVETTIARLENLESRMGLGPR